MRVLLGYIVIGLIWAIVSHDNAIRYQDPTFWRDAAIWPALVVIKVSHLRSAVPREWLEWSMIGFGVALVVYTIARLDFSGLFGRKTPARRAKRPG